LEFPDAVLEYPFRTFGDTIVRGKSESRSLETIGLGARDRIGVTNPLINSGIVRAIVLVESELHGAWILLLELEPGSIDPAITTCGDVSWVPISLYGVSSVNFGWIGLILEELKFSEFSYSVSV
jgi:hypothetical protein